MTIDPQQRIISRDNTRDEGTMLERMKAERVSPWQTSTEIANEVLRQEERGAMWTRAPPAPRPPSTRPNNPSSCPVQCKVLSGIHILDSLDLRSTYPLVVTTKIISRCCQMFPGGKKKVTPG